MIRADRGVMAWKPSRNDPGGPDQVVDYPASGARRTGADGAPPTRRNAAPACSGAAGQDHDRVEHRLPAHASRSLLLPWAGCWGPAAMLASPVPPTAPAPHLGGRATPTRRGGWRPTAPSTPRPGVRQRPSETSTTPQPPAGSVLRAPSWCQSPRAGAWLTSPTAADIVSANLYPLVVGWASQPAVLVDRRPLLAGPPQSGRPRGTAKPCGATSTSEVNLPVDHLG
jgi:hypothetical protein